MNIDLVKRRRVMERSQLLGHCICDVRRPCPCEVLREQGICPCAGERPDLVEPSQVKLTDLVHNAGCASKIAPADLEAVLGRLPAVTDPAVISGLAAGDDAAIYRIAEDLCVVQTVDVFTPCVDDPYLFGRICAANCLSDIYAMGGEPRTALSILAFPSETLPREIMYQLLAGAMEIFQQAGVALVGGHSIKDDELKLGFAITGVIDPAVATALETPRVGDQLVLTKPLGTGVLTFCQQIGRGHPEGLAAARAAMATLNRGAAEAMKEAGATACTDVTGFGLFAHLSRMLRGKNLGAELYADALPAFAGAVEALREGIVPGSIERNREYAGKFVSVRSGVDESLVNLGFDAQTSGGLLIAIPAQRLRALQAALARRGVDGFVIGRIVEAGREMITVLNRNGAVDDSPSSACAAEAPIRSGRRPVANATNGSELEGKPMKPAAAKTTGDHADCCAEVFQREAGGGSAAESQAAFGALMRSVGSAGAVGEKTKELILFSLVVLSRCQPCFEAHYAKARELGIRPEELDEAAWCAIAMGGAPVRMFYQECLKAARPGPAGGS